MGFLTVVLLTVLFAGLVPAQAQDIPKPAADGRYTITGAGIRAQAGSPPV